MILFVCSVYDKKVGAYTPPHFFRSHAEAVRTYERAVVDEKSFMFSNPEDFTFHVLGTFDDSIASFDIFPNSHVLCTALELRSRFDNRSLQLSAGGVK